MQENSLEKIWIAGPCAAETREQVLDTARALLEQAAARGVRLYAYRAGAWKMRSAPGGFSGAGEEALPWLSEIQQTLGIPVCVEVFNPQQVEKCAENNIKIVWVGARTAVNPVEVQMIADAVKHTDFTVMVKNPIVPDLKLWIGNIERFLNADVKNVMAVHRGFSVATENVYRNAPLWQIPVELRVAMPQLPILCDPSHISGHTKWISQLSQIALNYGFDGLMTECHVNPEAALSDAKQQLTPQQWGEMVTNLSLRSNTENLDLERLRSKLENIDHQLSELLYQRMTVVDEIAEVKRANDIAVVQPHQWEQVVKRYNNHSLDTNYQEFIEEFLKILHQASIKRQ